MTLLGRRGDPAPIFANNWGSLQSVIRNFIVLLSPRRLPEEM
jgi:hypothetical protein